MTAFVILYQPGFQLPCELFLIDTPGISDDKGNKHDKEIVKRIKKFFNDEEACLFNDIASVGFVIQASAARLTAEQQNVLNQVLNLFGKDLSGNVSFLFTFADAQDPTALKSVSEHGILFAECFNNSAVYAGNNAADELTLTSWNYGFSSLQRYAEYLKRVKVAKLGLTKQVLNSLESLRLNLMSLKPRIDARMDKLKSMEEQIETICRTTK